MTIGVVTGMQAEARLLDGLGYRVVAAGGNAAATRAKTAGLIRDGVTGLISFGIAGALDPSLRPAGRPPGGLQSRLVAVRPE